jgi:hypothetical protein
VTPVLGAIASVTSLLKAARTICSWIKDLRHAPEFVSDLQVYVEGFTVSIKGVQIAWSDPDVESRIASSQTNLVFSKANETPYQLQVTLKKVAQSPGSQVNRSKWVYYQSKCREQKEQLVTHQGSLNAIISTAHLIAPLDPSAFMNLPDSITESLFVLLRSEFTSSCICTTLYWCSLPPKR